MVNYFTKLNISIDTIDTSSFNNIPCRSFNNYVCYYDIRNTEKYQYLYEIFAPFKPAEVYWGNFPSARPHIDHDGMLTAINHYYNTLDAHTIFYEPKENAVPYCGKYETIPNYYHKEDIVEQTRFCANINDIYMLNITKIHGLDFPAKGVRQMVKWMFKIPYNEIYQELKNKQMCL